MIKWKSTEDAIIARNFDVLSYHPYPARFEFFERGLVGTICCCSILGVQKWAVFDPDRSSLFLWTRILEATIITL